MRHPGIPFSTQKTAVRQSSEAAILLVEMEYMSAVSGGVDGVIIRGHPEGFCDCVPVFERDFGVNVGIRIIFLVFG